MLDSADEPWRAVDAAYGCDDPHDDCGDARHAYRTEGRLIATHANPAAVLRRIEAERKLLAEHADDGYGDCVCCTGTHPVDCECDWRRLGGEHWRAALPHPCPIVRFIAEGWGWNGKDGGEPHPELSTPGLVGRGAHHGVSFNAESPRSPRVRVQRPRR